MNKAERLERKKEESKRMRKLVDNSYASDPRILKFRYTSFPFHNVSYQHPLILMDPDTDAG
jgi:hypothetical protein